MEMDLDDFSILNGSLGLECGNSKVYKGSDK